MNGVGEVHKGRPPLSGSLPLPSAGPPRCCPLHPLPFLKKKAGLLKLANFSPGREVKGEEQQGGSFNKKSKFVKVRVTTVCTPASHIPND